MTHGMNESTGNFFINPLGGFAGVSLRVESNRLQPVAGADYDPLGSGQTYGRQGSRHHWQ